MKAVLLILFLLWSSIGLAQDLHYARTAIGLLTAADMDGRGYVNNGHKKAADYIAGEFRSFGLQSLSPDFQQRFPLTVNTFPGKMLLKTDGQTLKPGLDFVIEPNAPGKRGHYEVTTINLDTLLKNFSGWIRYIKHTKSAICLDKTGFTVLSEEDQRVIEGLEEVLRFNKELTIPAIIILDEGKFVWGTSQYLSKRPVFRVKTSSIISKPIRHVKFSVKSVLLTELYSQNVIGFLNGKSDSAIVICAHYDHLGRMGKNTFFPGANDNASGVAMMLSIARQMSFFDQPRYSLLFIAFGGEEAGLVGSKYYVSRPLYPLYKTKFVINLDIVGTGDDGINVVNGKVYQPQFKQLLDINHKKAYFKNIHAQASRCSSDHCAFDQYQIPAFYIYTLGGIQAYHDIHDQFATLPLTKFENLFKLIYEFIQQ